MSLTATKSRSKSQKGTQQLMSNEKYRVNEMFRSVQAEGHNAGRSAVFVRLAGCNLNCKFCDTNFDPYVEMTAEEINSKIVELTGGDKTVLVVFTGGEPTMQLREDEPLGGDNPKAIETNGILPVPSWIGWVTVSPKTKIPAKDLKRANEVKVLYGLFDDEYLKSLVGIHASLYVQPLEANGFMNTTDCVKFVTANPQFRISIQWHKMTGVR